MPVECVPPFPLLRQNEGYTLQRWNFLPLPLTLKLETRFTDDELIQLSSVYQPYQLERNAKGELEIMSPTGWDGSGREEFVSRMLANWADAYGGAARGPTAAFHLNDTSIRSPDACWVSASRLQPITQEQKKRFLPICPNFLVEILSESDSRMTLERKMESWIAAGAELAWMIDPFAAEVLVYRPGTETETLIRPAWIEATSIVPGFRLEVSRLWEQSLRTGA